MNALLVLALLGGWKHIDFVADPIQRPAPPGPTPPAASCPLTGSDCGCKREPVMPPLKPAPEPPKAQRWRLADDTGQVWEFHDPVKLKEWVTARNARPTLTPLQPAAGVSASNTIRQAPAMYGFGGSGGGCSTGQCGR